MRLIDDKRVGINIGESCDVKDLNKILDAFKCTYKINSYEVDNEYFIYNYYLFIYN